MAWAGSGQGGSEVRSRESLALKPPIPKGPGAISRYAPRAPPDGSVAKAPEWGVARPGRGVGSAGGSAEEMCRLVPSRARDFGSKNFGGFKEFVPIGWGAGPFPLQTGNFSGGRLCCWQAHCQTVLHDGAKHLFGSL